MLVEVLKYQLQLGRPVEVDSGQIETLIENNQCWNWQWSIRDIKWEQSTLLEIVIS